MMLRLPTEALLWLEVFPDLHFHANEHIPILAGINSDGAREYVARVHDVRRPFDWGHPCTVAEGVSSVRYKAEDGKVRRSKHYDILVWKFEPHRLEGSRGPIAKDRSEGVFSWRKLSPRGIIAYERGNLPFMISFAREEDYCSIRNRRDLRESRRLRIWV